MPNTLGSSFSMAGLACILLLSVGWIAIYQVYRHVKRWALGRVPIRAEPDPLRMPQMAAARLELVGKLGCPADVLRRVHGHIHADGVGHAAGAPALAVADVEDDA